MFKNVLLGSMILMSSAYPQLKMNILGTDIAKMNIVTVAKPGPYFLIEVKIGERYYNIRGYSKDRIFKDANTLFTDVIVRKYTDSDIPKLEQMYKKDHNGESPNSDYWNSMIKTVDLTPVDRERLFARIKHLLV